MAIIMFLAGLLTALLAIALAYGLMMWRSRRRGLQRQVNGCELLDFFSKLGMDFLEEQDRQYQSRRPKE